MLVPAVRTADRPLGPDQYRYIATRGWWMGSFGTSTGLLLHLTEQWIRQWVPARPDRDWMLDREVTGRVRWLTGTAEQADDEGFDPAAGFRPAASAPRTATSTRASTTCPRGPRTGTWHTPTTAFLSGLPRDPRALLARLCADGPEGRTASQPFARAAGALRSGLVPADLRAALYAALTALPAVTLDEDTTDCAGNPRLALVHDDGPTRTELIIDPVDGTFAGERDTLRTASRLGLAAGTVVLCTSVTTSVVDTLGGLPA